MAACTSRTRATSLSAPDAEQVAAGDEGEHRGLRDAPSARRARHVEGVADDRRRRSRAVAQQPEDRRAQGRREVGVDRRDQDVRRHHRGHAGLDRGRERHQLAFGEARRGSTSTAGSARCESWAVSPWPGKCLAQAATPAACRPEHPGRHVVGRRCAGSAPKLRTPMTGLSGLEFTSATGARSRSMPTRGQLGADRAAACRGSASRSSAAPSAAGPRTGLPLERVQAGDVAALLVDRDHGAPVRPRVHRGRQSSASRRARRRCWAEEADPAEPGAEQLRPQSGGASVPTKPGSCTRRRELARASRHPFTAPATRPADHPALDDQEEDDDRHGDERRAGHDAAPVGAAVDAR